MAQSHSSRWFGRLCKKNLTVEYIEENSISNEKELRERLVATAFEYTGSPYRWGGKTPLGIDCSGLVSMAYMLNGIFIYRDAKIADGFPVKEISNEKIQKGDLVFFPGHVGMYIGNDEFVHSSSYNGGVSVNSFDKTAGNFNARWASAECVGSVFGRP